MWPFPGTLRAAFASFLVALSCLMAVTAVHAADLKPGAAACAGLLRFSEACPEIEEARRAFPPGLDTYLRVYAKARAAASPAPSGRDLLGAIEEGIADYATVRRAIEEAMGAQELAALPDGALRDALLCPGLLTASIRCLGQTSALGVGGDAAKAAKASIERAMRKASQSPRFRNACSADAPSGDKKQGAICLLISADAVEAVAWLDAWAQALHEAAAGLKGCGNGQTSVACARALHTALVEAAAIWMFSAELTDMGMPTACRNAQLTADLQKIGGKVGTLRAAPQGDAKPFLAVPTLLKSLLEIRLLVRGALKASGPALAECMVRQAAVVAAPAVEQRKIPLLDTSSQPLRCEADDFSTGYVDVCNGEGAGYLGYLGLRISFAPPSASVAGPGCGTVAQISLLFRGLTDGQKPSLTVVDSGVSSLQLPSFCIAAERWRMLSYPHVRAVKLNRTVMASALRLLIPRPLVLEVQDITLVPSPGPKGTAGLSNLRVNTSVSVPGLVDAVALSFDLGGPHKLDPQSVLQLVRAKLSAAIAARLGVEITAIDLFRAPACFPEGDKAPRDGELMVCLRPGFLPAGAVPAMPARVQVGPDGDVVLRLVPSGEVESLKAWIASQAQGMIGTGLAASVHVEDLTVAANQWRLSIRLDAGDAQGLVVALQCALGAKNPLAEWGAQLKAQAAQIAAELALRALEAQEKRFIAMVHQFIDGSFARPLKLRLRSLSGRPLRGVMEMNLPGISGPIQVQLDQGGVSTADSVRDAVLKELQGKINQRLKAVKDFTPVQGLTITQPQIELDARGASASLLLKGRLRVSEKPAVSLGLSMSLVPLDKPKIEVEDLKTQLLALFTAMSIKGWAINGPPTKQRTELTFVGMVPVLRVPVSAAIDFGPQFGLQGTATIVLRPDADSRLGYVEIGCFGTLCWFPAGPGLMIGNPRGGVDFDQPSRFNFGATLTFVPGPGTEKVMRLDADLYYEESRVRAEGPLFLADQPIGHSDAEWDFRTGVVTMDIRAADGWPVPMPAINAVLDGRHCVLAGRAHGDFLGLTQANVVTGVRALVGGTCNGSVDPELVTARPELEGVLKACSSVSSSTVATCGSGSVTLLGNLSGNANFAMPMLPPASPSASVDFNLDLGFTRVGVQTALRPRYASFRADLGFKVVTVIVPGLESIDRDKLVQLILDQLKTSFDLNALLQKEVVISLLPPSDSTSEDSPDSPSDAQPKPQVSETKETQPTSDAKDGAPASGTPTSGTTASGTPTSGNSGDAAPSVRSRLKNGASLRFECPSEGELCTAWVGETQFLIARANVEQLHSDDLKLTLVSPNSEADVHPAPANPFKPMSLRPEWSGNDNAFKPSDALGRWLLACKADNCAFDQVWVMPIARTGAARPPITAAVPWDFASLSDNIFVGPIERRPLLPGTFASITNAVARASTTPVVCLANAEQSDACVAALTSTSDGRFLIEISGVGAKVLPANSPEASLVKLLCPDNNCGRNEAGSRLVNQLLTMLKMTTLTWQAMGNRHWSVAQETASESAPRRLGLFSWPSDNFVPFATFQFGGYCRTRSQEEPCRRFVSALLDQLGADDVALGGDWIVQSSVDSESPRLFAGYKNDPVDPWIAVAVYRRGKAFVQVRRWRELRDTMDKWVEAGWLARTGPATALALVQALSASQISADSFRRNPLLLFGDGLLKSGQ